MKKVIGVRSDKVAQLQAQWVITKLTRCYPGLDFEIKEMSKDAQGKKTLNEKKEKIWFVQEAQEQLLSHKIDLVIHNMEDMPSILPEQLIISTIPVRLDPRKAVVLMEGYEGLQDLPENARIGVENRLVEKQLLVHFPKFQTVHMNGNLEDNLKLMKREKLDGMIMSAALFQSSNLEEKVSRYLELDVMLPHPGEGALAIVIREEDRELSTILQVLEDPVSLVEVKAEREFYKAISDNQNYLIGAHCDVIGKHIRLVGEVIDKKDLIIHQELCAPIGCEREVGEELARKILTKIN